jgi:hypothetical protein
VILTNSFEKSGRLVACLRTLFPECKIEMQSGMDLLVDASGMFACDTKDVKLDETHYRSNDF